MGQDGKSLLSVWRGKLCEGRELGSARTGKPIWAAGGSFWVFNRLLITAIQSRGTSGKTNKKKTLPKMRRGVFEKGEKNERPLRTKTKEKRTSTPRARTFLRKGKFR